MSDTPLPDPEPEAPSTTPEPVNEPGNPQTNEPIVPVTPPELDPSTPRQPDAAAAAVLFDPWLEQYTPDLTAYIQGADGRY